MTEEKPYGWKSADGKVLDVGGYPMTVRNVDAAVTLRGRKAVKSVRVLDEHGYARETLKPVDAAGGLTVRLAPNAVYTLVE